VVQATRNLVLFEDDLTLYLPIDPSQSIYDLYYCPILQLIDASELLFI